MSVLGTIFWLWLAVSVVVLVKRHWDRGVPATVGAPSGPEGGVRSDDAEPLGLHDPLGGAEDPGNLVSARSTDDGSPPPAPDPGGSGPAFDRRTPRARDEGEDRSYGSIAPPAGSVDHDTTVVADSPTTVADRSARPVPGSPARRDRDPAAAPRNIAEALSGIRMPCDLAPLTLGVADLDPTYADLVTTGVAPGELAAQLDDELTRLGYDVEDLGAGEHLATREGTAVEVRIHDHPASSVGVGGRGFTTAPPESIVVEFCLT